MKDIYLKMTKEWGGFRVGDVVRFGYTKGLGRIENGEGVKVSKQQAVNDPEPKPKKKKPEVETATVDLSVEKVETAEVTPKKAGRPKKRGN